jgi:hypothetical protein
VTFRSGRIPAFLLIAALVACKGRHSRTEVKNEEPAAAAPTLASNLKMSDQAAEKQLVKGFYSLETGAWRWTAGQFQVLLKPPTGAAQTGAKLTFSFSLPEVSVKKLGGVTLDASIGGTRLKAETYSKPGPYTYTADVPAAQLAGESVTVDFKLDKSLPAGAVDQRELGLVATAVGLEGK